MNIIPAQPNLYHSINNTHRLIVGWEILETERGLIAIPVLAHNNVKVFTKAVVNLD